MKKLVAVSASVGLLSLFTAFGKQPANVVFQDAMALPGNTFVGQAKIPAALVGTWRNGAIVTVDFFNPQTGAWNNVAGNGMFLAIQPNGEYRLGAAEPVYLNNAEARYLVYQHGKITVVDAQLVLSPSSGFVEVHEMNMPPRNTERSSNDCDLQSSAFIFRLVQAQGRPMLELVTETGERMTLGYDGL